MLSVGLMSEIGLLFRRQKEESKMSLTQLCPEGPCTVQPSEKISQAARMMCDRSVGALVITDENRETPLAS